MSFEEGADLSASHRCREWLAAVLGNTHVRWGWFVGETLVKVEQFPAHQPLSWPEQTELWLAPVGSAPLPPESPWVHRLELSQVPLRDPYPGLGLDRALALWAAGIHYGWPCLVIDAGTALTLTGADSEGSLVGGAILPGLGLQAQALADYTARLPKIHWDPCSPLPPRWATDTVAAIRSGILHTLLAGLREFIADWRRRFPQGPLLLTGGDGEWLYSHLQSYRQNPVSDSGTESLSREQRGKSGEKRASLLTPHSSLLTPLHWDPHLVLRGIACCRQWHRAAGQPPVAE